MRVLITGGSGFVGQRLCRRLVDAGHRVQVVSRSPAQAAKVLPEGADVRVSALDFVDAPPGVLVNLAGEPIADKRWSDTQKERLIDSRINATRELVMLCEQLSQTAKAPRVLVSGSAMGFYGDQGGGEDAPTVTEQTAPHDEFAHRLCKRWEQAAAGVKDFGVRLAILRTGLVLDEGGGMLKKLLPPFKLGLGGRLGKGDQYMPWIHREDLVEMILWLIEKEHLSGPFNGSAPEPVTNREFTEAIGRHLKRPTPFPVPAMVLETAFGEMSRLLLTGARMVPQRFEEEGFSFRYPTLDKALDDIL
ncbi:NAD-dependent dehydratase [Halomonas sp. S2151]|uniref:TIGR01777 family oxidoreductase n=1 Tax=unclassified Halomonas TaxID=2609666 RepID=UPI0005F9E538|nr:MULTISPECIES: TIGR01777 family oxidoreductase [unclassified Halomonas]KJZ07602.1 NAD-dependent dehydratase [Halomonas sp. S2151]MAR72163.1 TIGR01777 family protein [Halomonas sp.]MBR9772079.1 TIGR01777 family protein [Gammaproteobacteria bacterium]MBY5942584.1 TIGR01777 family oxidoreductase [Halomonas sp. DP5N14-9]|tara:strand:+ start:614 stop:1525 length:912 start_codon:yes stop_codon:yes gene_type:complete